MGFPAWPQCFHFDAKEGIQDRECDQKHKSWLHASSGHEHACPVFLQGPSSFHPGRSHHTCASGTLVWDPKQLFCDSLVHDPCCNAPWCILAGFCTEKLLIFLEEALGDQEGGALLHQPGSVSAQDQCWELYYSHLLYSPSVPSDTPLETWRRVPFS